MWIIYAIGAAEIIVLIVCLMWSGVGIRKRAVASRRELDRTIYMMEVQKLLFGTHTDVSYLEKALGKCAEMLCAEKAFILTLENEKVRNLYTCPSGENQPPAEQILFQMPVVRTMMKERKSIVINRMEEASCDLRREIGLLNDPGIKSIMLVPVMENENTLRAVLGVVNFKKKYESAELLECITPNFLMAILNYNSYQRIKEMATIDMLTGLKNRNSYQQDIAKLAKMSHRSLCCIYMDVNGLHELNNHLGHAAGDEMLHKVGVSLLTHFGADNAYRLGGDEFVAFCKDMSEHEVSQKIESFLYEMEEQHYQISVGSFWQDTTLQIDAMISNAEKQMYENKRLYYEKKGDAGKAREMNRKLEETLLQKKDFEYFLSLIAHYFLGVYVVDFNTDMTRAIYKPSYFDEILQKNDNRYRVSIEEYCRTFVKEEEQDKIIAFLDYDNIIGDLASRKVVHTMYKRKDNTCIRLRIFASADFCDKHRETFWLFEEVSARYH